MATELPYSSPSSSSSASSDLPPSPSPPPGTYPLDTGDRVTSIKTLEVIQRQCHIVASNGATVRQYAAQNGDIVVIIEEMSILDNIKYQARVRFIGSGYLIRQHIPTAKDKQSTSSALGLAYTTTNNSSPLPSIQSPSHVNPSSSPNLQTSDTDSLSPSSSSLTASNLSKKKSSSSSGPVTPSKTRRTIYEIEDDLNLNFITEIVRIYPDGRTERVKTWPFAPDGRCIVQTIPNFPGRGWGLDALPFVHQWIFRSDEQIMRYDGTDLLLNRLHQQIAAQRYAANATCTALKAAQQQQNENRQRLIAAAHSLLSSKNAKEAAPHVPNFLRLLTQADLNTLVNIRMYTLQQRAGSANDEDEENEEDEEGNEYTNSSSSAARLQKRNASLSRNPLIPSFIRKKIRRPNVVWRYNMFPIPVPISTFVSLGRYPDQPWKFYDQMVESSLWYWLNLDKEPPAELTALDIQQQHEAKKDKSMEKQLRKLKIDNNNNGTRSSTTTTNSTDEQVPSTMRRSKIAVIRTVHIPYPIPVTHAVIVNPAIQRFVDKRTYVTDLSSLSNTANCRREGGELPPLWRGHMHWQVQVRNDNGTVEVCGPPYDGLGMNTKQESSNEDITNLLGQSYPLCNPSYPPHGPQILYRVGKDTDTVIPRSTRVHFHTSAAPFTSQEHLDALVELRNQNMQNNIPLCPKPWIEDDVWIPPDSAIDTATVTALAAAVYPILTTEVNLKDILPSALDLPLQEKDPEPETVENNDEHTENNSEHTTNNNNKNETARSAATSLSSSSSSSGKNGASSSSLIPTGKPKYVIPPIPEPHRWYFIDEIGAFSSTLWYQRLISSKDPFWFYKPPITVGYRLDTSLPMASQERAIIIREGIYESVRQFTYLTNGSSNGIPTSPTAPLPKAVPTMNNNNKRTTTGSSRIIDGPYLLRGYDENMIIPVVEGLVVPRPISPHSLKLFTRNGNNQDGKENL